MTLQEAMEQRHSVRAFTTQPIERATLTELQQLIDDCNKESGLHMQLVLNEPTAFTGLLSRAFQNAVNYLVLVGRDGPGFLERCGYYGQKVTLRAQQLGLRSCWVGGTYRRRKCPAQIAPGEKFRLVVVLGYAEKDGGPHKSKPLETLYTAQPPVPDWFLRGMQAAQLAPTAMNQQRFHITLNGDTVTAKTTGGVFSETDLGIVKYQFEVAAGTDGWRWA